jgi:hypothetical protein|eukprot:COSAG06_NODE_2136_length_7521_cov_5.249461_2_plen_69_part_00
MCVLLTLIPMLRLHVQAFRPVVPVSAVFEQLGFEDMAACEAYLADPKLRTELSIEFTPDRRAVRKMSG